MPWEVGAWVRAERPGDDRTMNPERIGVWFCVALLVALSVLLAVDGLLWDVLVGE